MKSRIDGIEYAVKCTQRQFRGEGDKNRYLKEVKALGKLCQDDTEETRYIVRYFGAWFEDRRLYMQVSEGAAQEVGGGSCLSLRTAIRHV